MKGARRLFSALLALAIVCGMARFPADAADSGYRMSILRAQTLTEGTPFDPDTAPDAENVKTGDIVVLTLGFHNDSDAAIEVAGFSAKLLYDETKVTPYVGTAPFSRNPYQFNAALTDSYGWTQTGNGKGDGFVSVSGGGPDACSIESNAQSDATLVLCRIAFQANADGAASFALDEDPAKTRVIGENRQALALEAFEPFNLTISAGGNAPDKPSGPNAPDNPSGPDTPDAPSSSDASRIFSLQVVKAQTLTEGTAFDPDTAPDAENVNPGDIVVLTLGFRNDTGAAVNVAGFSAKLLYDEMKVAPYTGTAPFAGRPYQISSELTGEYDWSQAGNGNGDGFISVTCGGSDAYSVKSGATLILCRIAFQANADTFEGAAEFVLDPDKTKTRVIGENSKPLTLDEFQTFRLSAAIPCEITAVSAYAGKLTVKFSNPEAVTVAVAFFNADKRCVSVKITDAPAQCGSVEIPLPDASEAKAMLLDSDLKPLCSSFAANIA